MGFLPNAGGVLGSAGRHLFRVFLAGGWHAFRGFIGILAGGRRDSSEDLSVSGCWAAGSR